MLCAFVCVVKDKQTLASGGDDGLVKIWEFRGNNTENHLLHEKGADG